ncbi:unnamed protein product [Lupinus luteus]|uniref:Uncharacterized protein n=1 Tax=Lupinus luteus TaxID=3873 RepID=A0AAV1XSN4_LUPLU
MVIIGRGSDSSCGDAVISSDIQQAPVVESIVIRRDIDLNIPIDLSCDNDCLPIDHEIGSENNLNLEVSSIPSSEVCLGFAEEVHRKKRVHEGDEISDIEPVANNVIIEHPTGHLPPQSVACSDVVPTGNTGNIVKDGIQDHHPPKSTHKKRRKMRLITDLLSENQEPGSEQIAGQGSASHPPCNVSADSQTPSTLPDRVDVQEGMSFRKRGRKRKFLPDEESKKPAHMCFQRIENEVQNPQGDARTIDTVLDNISEDALVSTSLQDGMKGHQYKPELERSHTMGKKGITENEGASTEKGMDNSALDVSIIENESNFSKGKGKMLQVDEELDYLSCWKNDELVEDAFAHTREKVLPNMPASVSIPSTQGAPNREGLEEGLHLSLNCYSSIEACSKNGICQTKNWLPLSLTVGTSKPQLTGEDSESNIFTASRHTTNAISRKGKEAHLEEIDGAGNKTKTVQFYDLTTEELGEEAYDDVTMEVLELMGRNQYERSLPDAENRSGLLDKSTQMAKHQAGDRTNGTVRREENVLPAKGNPTNIFYPYGGNQFGLNNVSKTQSPFGLEVLQSKNKPSKGLYFSPMDTFKFGATGASRFNRGVAEHGSSSAALQARGGSNLCKSTPIQHYGASRPWPTLTSNALLGFDAAPRQVSQPTSSSNMNMTSLQSGSMHTIPAMNLLGHIGRGRQSARSFNAGVGAEMLQRAFYFGACSNNLRIDSATSDRTMIKSGKGERSKSAMQSGVSKQFRWPNLERKLDELVSGTDVRGTQGISGPSNTISENLCMLNKNPADFTLSVERNAYTINGEDLKFEKGVPEEMSDLPVHAYKLKRNMKGKMKEHEKV